MNILTPNQQQRADKAIAGIARKLIPRGLFDLPNQHAPGGASLLRDCQAIVKAFPVETMAFLKRLFRVPQTRWTDAEKRAISQGDSSLGAATSLPAPLNQAFLDLLTRHSTAFRTFGIYNLEAAQEIIPILSGRAGTQWITTASQGSAITETATLAGSNSAATVATLAALIEASGELVADGGQTAAAIILRALVEGTDYRLTWTCCQGDGTDDTVSGGFTGLFASGGITAVQAAAGHTSVASLSHDDLVNLIAGPSPDTLSHPCQFISAPGNLPKLLKIRSSPEIGGEPVLKPPTTPDGDWMLLGFPVRWASGAPTADEAGAKVLCFGRGESYIVGIRQNFEFSASDAPGFFKNTRLLRALIRARCELADGDSFACLQLAAE